MLWEKHFHVKFDLQHARNDLGVNEVVRVQAKEKAEAIMTHVVLGNSILNSPTFNAIRVQDRDSIWAKPFIYLDTLIVEDLLEESLFLLLVYQLLVFRVEV